MSILAVVGLLFAGVGATAAIAQADDGGEDGTVEIASQDIVVNDAVVTVGGAHLSGPGLPNEQIDERTYTLQDATVDIQGLDVTWNGTDYTICRITITFDDVGVTIHDVTLSDGS